MSLTYFINKFVCVFLGFVFLLQSCAVYQKTPASMAEASATNHKVLIIKTDGTKLKLKKVEQVDGMYYGIIEDDKGIKKIPLKPRDIKTIRLLDKSASTFLSIGTVVIPIVIIIIISAVDWGPGNLGLGE